jgi:uncharacterized protein (DUF2384 family)
MKEIYKIAGKDLAEKILDVFEGEKIKATDWFYSPIKSLGGKSPEECCKEKNYFKVEQELRKIEHRFTQLY